MQILYSIYPKVWKESNILSIKDRYPENNKRFVKIEGDRNNRRAYDAGSYTPFTINSSKVQRISNHGISKGKSAMMILERHANLKYKYGNRHFWAEGYYVSTVSLNTATIKKYIREQEKEDQIMDKLKAKEYSEPFKGSK